MVRRHGVRGELRLLPFNPGSPALRAATRVALCDGESPPQWIGIAGARPHKNLILLRFDDIDTAEKADALIGRVVAVPRQELPPLDDGEIYHCDLLECRVETESGETLGTVDEILPTGSNDVLIVRGQGREYLIPLIDQVVIEIDAPASRIVIRPIPGLLDP